jgi:hypothetical protein
MKPHAKNLSGEWLSTITQFVNFVGSRHELILSLKIKYLEVLFEKNKLARKEGPS